MRLHEASTFEGAVWSDHKALFAKRNVTVILDVGANVGNSVSFYGKCFPDSQIWAFEPFPEAFQALSERFRQNPKVHPVDCAISDSRGVSRFYLNEYSDTNSLLPRPMMGRRYYWLCNTPVGCIDVKTTTLDDFAACASLDHIDILKIDIQGGEHAALRGAERLLSQQKIDVLFLEAFFVPHYEGALLFHELSDLLQGFGYSVFNLYDMIRAANGQLRFADALFVSRNFRNSVVDGFPSEP